MDPQVELRDDTVLYIWFAVAVFMAVLVCILFRSYFAGNIRESESFKLRAETVREDHSEHKSLEDSAVNLADSIYV